MDFSLTTCEQFVDVCNGGLACLAESIAVLFKRSDIFAVDPYPFVIETNCSDCGCYSNELNDYNMHFDVRIHSALTLV